MSRRSLGPTSRSTAEDNGLESPEEKVGYGSPPVSTRFKPGESGNRRGRPKGSKSLAQVLREALERRVPDPRRRGRHTVRMIELIVEGLVLGAARRDPGMLRLLLALMDRFTPTDAPASQLEEIRAADREILDEFIASVTATGRSRNGER